MQRLCRKEIFGRRIWWDWIVATQGRLVSVRQCYCSLERRPWFRYLGMLRRSLGHGEQGSRLHRRSALCSVTMTTTVNRKHYQRQAVANRGVGDRRQNPKKFREQSLGSPTAHYSQPRDRRGIDHSRREALFLSSFWEHYVSGGPLGIRP